MVTASQIFSTGTTPIPLTMPGTLCFNVLALDVTNGNQLFTQDYSTYEFYALDMYLYAGKMVSRHVVFDSSHTYKFVHGDVSNIQMVRIGWNLV
mmetsp:Transcript_16548/g.19138  ORF Transcript_16548/g.19138 Transcript_16548/m.19138 type:complete len:94 (+) Transcript_16548:158-439(+)